MLKMEGEPKPCPLLAQSGHCECHEMGGLNFLMIGPPGAGNPSLKTQFANKIKNAARG